MKRPLVWIVGLGSSFLLLRVFVYVIPETLCILLSCLFALGLLVFLGITLKTGITKWRTTSPLWFLPSLICVACILVGFWIMPLIGPHISDSLFRKNLEAYSRVVDDFKKGAIPCTESYTAKMAPMEVANRPAHVLAIWGVHCDDGGAIVLFIDDTDVMLLHEGYFFKDYGTSSYCASLSPEVGWPRVPFVRHIAGPWYHFSDQPGL